MTEDLNQVLRQRREKLDALHDAGTPAFAYGYDRTHRSSEAIAAFEKDEAAGALDENGYGATVRVGGRIVAWRGHGKTSFSHIEDGAGRIQLYFRRDDLGDEVFDALGLLDISDWIGAEGRLFRTRRGEVSVEITSCELLSKSLRPLPFGKVEVDRETGERTYYSGFSDAEARYRQRYADLAVHPEVREVFRTRTKIVTEIRRFLDGEDFLEVETPALQPLYGGAAARPFITHHNALDQRMYLRIADELYLKRLIVGGFERVYEIAKDFRNEGVDRTHNPEFTMLEFYQAFADYEDMMSLIERLLIHVVQAVHGTDTVTWQGTELSFAGPFARVSFMDGLAEKMGEDPAGLSDEELKERCKAAEIPDLDGAGRGKLLDKLFEHHLEPHLIQPTFLIDYPIELSPLAKKHRSRPGLTERFELFACGKEVANAFTELNDPIDQRERFEAQAGLRAGGDDEAHVIDDDYIRAMEYGMPPTGGLGMGVDRLVMLLTDQASIRDVILFPVLRNEEQG